MYEYKYHIFKSMHFICTTYNKCPVVIQSSAPPPHLFTVNYQGIFFNK